MNVPAEGYLKAVREWCDQQGILLIFDEIQTGLGRLGTLFGYQAMGVEPDVMTLAKGLGGGVPIGAFLSRERCSVLEPGDHGSTFGGNALTCAAAYASTKYMVDNDVPALGKEIGAYLKQRLEELRARQPAIVDVRGMGLLLAVEFKEEIAAKVLAACNQKGLLLNAVRPNAVRIMPPLTLTTEEVDLGVERLEQGVSQVV